MALGSPNHNPNWQVHDFGDGIRTLVWNEKKGEFYIVENANTPTEKVREPNDAEILFIQQNFPRKDGTERQWTGGPRGIDVADVNLAKSILDTMRSVNGKVKTVAGFTIAHTALDAKVDAFGKKTGLTEVDLAGLENEMIALRVLAKGSVEQGQVTALNAKIKTLRGQFLNQEHAKLRREFDARKASGNPSNLIAIKAKVEDFKAAHDLDTTLKGLVDTLIGEIDAEITTKSDPEPVRAAEFKRDHDALDAKILVVNGKAPVDLVETELIELQTDFNALRSKAKTPAEQSQITALQPRIAADFERFRDFEHDELNAEFAKPSVNTDKTQLDALKVKATALKTKIHTKYPTVETKVDTLLTGIDTALNSLVEVGLRGRLQVFRDDFDATKATKSVAELNAMKGDIVALRTEINKGGFTATPATATTLIGEIDAEITAKNTNEELKSNSELSDARDAANEIQKLRAQLAKARRSFDDLNNAAGTANHATAAKLNTLRSALGTLRSNLEAQYKNLSDAQTTLGTPTNPALGVAMNNIVNGVLTTPAITHANLDAAERADEGAAARLEADSRVLDTFLVLTQEQQTRLSAAAPADSIDNLRNWIAFRENITNRIPSLASYATAIPASLTRFSTLVSDNNVEILDHRIDPMARSLVRAQDTAITALQGRATALTTRMGAATPHQIPAINRDVQTLRTDFGAVQTSIQNIQNSLLTAPGATTYIVNLAPEINAYNTLETELTGLEERLDGARIATLRMEVDHQEVEVGLALIAFNDALHAYQDTNEITFRWHGAEHYLNPLREQRNRALAAFRIIQRSRQEAVAIRDRHAASTTPTGANIASEFAAIDGAITRADLDMGTIMMALNTNRERNATPARTLMEAINAGSTESTMVGGERVPAFNAEQFGPQLMQLTGVAAQRAYIAGVNVPALVARNPLIVSNGVGITTLTGTDRDNVQREVLQLLGFNPTRKPSFADFRARMVNHFVNKLAPGVHRGHPSEAIANDINLQLIDPVYEALSSSTDATEYDAFFAGMTPESTQDRMAAYGRTAWGAAKVVWGVNAVYDFGKTLTLTGLGMAKKGLKTAAYATSDLAQSVLGRAKQGFDAVWENTQEFKWATPEEGSWVTRPFRNAWRGLKRGVTMPFALSAGLAWGAVAGGFEGGVQAAADVAGITYNDTTLEKRGDVTPAEIAEKLKAVLGEETAKAIEESGDIETAMGLAMSALEEKGYDGEKFLQAAGILEENANPRFIDRFALAKDYGVVSVAKTFAEGAVKAPLAPLRAFTLPLFRDIGKGLNWASADFGALGLSAATFTRFLPDFSSVEANDVAQAFEALRDLSPKYSEALSNTEGSGLSRYFNALLSMDSDDIKKSISTLVDLGGYKSPIAAALPYIISFIGDSRFPNKAFGAEKVDYDKFLGFLSEEEPKQRRLLGRVDRVELLNKFERILDPSQNTSIMETITGADHRAGGREARAVLQELKSFFGRSPSEGLSRAAARAQMAQWNALATPELQAATSNVTFWIDNDANWSAMNAAAA